MPTYSGRAAIYQLMLQLERGPRNVVLVPAFHCPTVIEPIMKAGYRARYYGVTHDLAIDARDFLCKLDGDVVAALVINYFGFPAQLEEARNVCAANDVLLIEDCAHSFLADDPLRLTGDRGDVAIYSYKKLVPCLVGGGVRINTDRVLPGWKQTKPPLLDTLVNCKRLFEQGIDNLDDGWVKRCYNTAESCRVRFRRRFSFRRAMDPVNAEVKTSTPYFDYSFDQRSADSCLPWYASRILASADLATITEARRRNYLTLQHNVNWSDEVSPVYRDLAPSVCPWAFPVLINDRATIDRCLNDRGVPLFTFGETSHASLATECAQPCRMLDVAGDLAARILCFSIHQGIAQKDIERYAATINDVLSSRRQR